MASNDLDILYRNLHFVRKTWGLTQSQFGKYFDLTRAQVASYEQGHAQPKLEFLFLLSDVLGLELNEIVNQNLTIEEIPASPIDGKKERTKLAPVRSMDDPLMNHITLVEFTRELEERIAKLEDQIKKK